MQHLLAGCSFSRQVWHEILAWARSTAELPNEDTDFHTLWATICVFLPTGKRKVLGSLIILTALVAMETPERFCHRRRPVIGLPPLLYNQR